MSKKCIVQREIQRKDRVSWISGIANILLICLVIYISYTFVLAKENQFDETDFILLLFAVMVLVSSVASLYTCLHEKLVPEQNRILRQVRRYGDVAEVAASINQEFSQSSTSISNIYKFHTLTVTPSWLLSFGFWKFNILLLSDIVWVYQKIEESSLFIPQHHLVVCDSHGIELTIPVNRRYIAGLLQFFSTEVPWAIVGYDENSRRGWDNHRQEFLSLVQQRREYFHLIDG